VRCTAGGTNDTLFTVIGGNRAVGLNTDGILGATIRVNYATSIVMRPGTPTGSFIYADEENDVVREVYPCTTATMPPVNYIGIPDAFVPAGARGSGGNSTSLAASCGGGGGGGDAAAAGGISGGAVAGIVVGVLAAVGLVVAGVVFGPKLLAAKALTAAPVTGKAGGTAGSEADGIQLIPTAPPAAFAYGRNPPASNVNPMLLERAPATGAVAAAGV
jgi:hypothetical protein